MRNKHTVSPLPPTDSLHIVKETLQYRAEIDSFFATDSDSPFNRDTTITYEGIKWFPIDVQYYVLSKLYLYEYPDTVIIFGTQSDKRKHLRYGYFLIQHDGKDFTLNVYTSIIESSTEQSTPLLVWFTDETTGKETYPVGRYIHIGEEETDRNHVYVINFNNAYNPYCAYSTMYSCAIPRKEDHLPWAIRTGEMTYHHE